MLTERNGTDKFTVIVILIAAGFLIILLRLWQLQILQGEELLKLSESNRLRVVGVPAPRGIIFDRNRIPLVKNAPYFCASIILEEFDRNLVSGLAALLGMPPEDLAKTITRRDQNPFTPVRVKEGLTFEEVSVLEARRSEYPGLVLEVEATRRYIYGTAGAHIVGYLGKMTPAQIKDPSFRDVPPEAFIGQWGAEKLFDRSLRGTAGQKIIEVDAFGREIRLLRETAPVKGEDLVLSIDIALQKEAEDALTDKAGALVAIDPDNGEVLGLVSAPSFDPNKFAKGIRQEDWDELMHDKKLPMLNRALQSQYPPGSTFKTVVALAGLQEHAIDEKTRVDCRGGISYGKWRFGCWKKGGHGVVSLHRALTESCDVYFYETGKRLGFDKIADYARLLGLGEPTGIRLTAEKKGLIPDSSWKKEVKHDDWYLGETFINSIGQGYVSTTPAQMAMMVGAVANGGNLYEPSILKVNTPKLKRNVALNAEMLEAVRAGLVGVVNEPSGTAWGSRSQMTTMAGKTGTAQVVSIRKDSSLLAERFRDHAWFIAYAPADNPSIALSVFVEHGGHGGSAAAPIARKAIEAYMLPIEKKKEALGVQD